MSQVVDDDGGYECVATFRYTLTVTRAVKLFSDLPLTKHEISAIAKEKIEVEGLSPDISAHVELSSFELIASTGTEISSKGNL